MKPLSYSKNVGMGSDSELFLSNSETGEIVGSERFVPENGVKYSNGSVVRDGIQIELHPHPETCRAYCCNNLSNCFFAIKSELSQKHPGIGLNFSSVVKVSRKELNSLSEASKIFGCQPSENVYFNEEESKIKVNPKKYLKRSGGGHLHYSGSGVVLEILKKPKISVPVLDLVVGNTSVLLDRNKENKERRKNYGRASEFRIKEYGQEYRTLSNFWLQSQQLYSMVLGLSRLAIHIAYQSTNNEESNYVERLNSLVSRDNVVKAIQDNNFDLAYENFSKIEELLLDITRVKENYENYPIHRRHVKEFHHFISKGIQYWFKENPIEHWTNNYKEGHNMGFENFLMNPVRQDMLNQCKVLEDKTLAEIWS